ncbi:MAG TPA: trehalose-6-phosphate synthase [Acetobacteraceae bacterium]|nr:trehalose-6-phosphate synthase [Acetobacteraceae bacterium]
MAFDSSGDHMSARLILVSNRVAVPGEKQSAGGLTVAIQAAQKLRDSVWLGWSGAITEAEVPPPPREISRSNRSYVLQDLPANDHQEYYNGFANRVLWPILHYRQDLAEFNNVDLDGYLRVNRHFANAVARILQPDDVVWVHDYHFLTLARDLRQQQFGNMIGFFLHIPCPPPDLLLALPQHAETLGMLTYYDLIGVQTERDAEKLGRYFETALGAVPRGDGLYECDGRRVQVKAFPVGIATEVYARAARQAVRCKVATELDESLGDKKLIIGVDRLDYTKGIPQRIQSFGQFLEKFPDWRNRVSYLQVTPKSRSDVKEYAEIEREVSTLVGQINGAQADPAWTPIRYVNRPFSRAILAGMYRMADVGLVTPVRDGMNLVAKEFIAAQDPEDPGVLILSQFAGAAERFTSALLVNPHETEAVAAAIKEALDMGLNERRARWQAMFDEISLNSIDRWAEDYLAALAATRQGGWLREGFWRLFSARV